jgi:hypothetical protein
MQGNEILEYLTLFPLFKKHFKGLFSIDTLPKSLGYRKFLIANTDIEKGEGKHWFSCFQSHKNVIEVFDSLGIDEIKKNLLLQYCKFYQKELIFNTTAFQDSSSSSCGQFVLYFCVERMFNLDVDFDDFLDLIFEENVKKNEETVLEFCREIKDN